MSDYIKKQVEIYEKQFLEHGDSPDGTFNQNSVIQNLRFERLLKQFNFNENSYTIHDVGCGICDLYEYMKQQNMHVNYSGTEIVQAMKDLAQKKYPEIEIAIRDVIKEDVKDTYDIVVLSGTFNLPGDVSKKDWKQFTRDMIKSMFDMCEVGISFNFLSTEAEFYNDLMYYESPQEIVDFCSKELSRFVTLDHSYPLFEQTITVLKKEYVESIYSDKQLKKYF